MGRSGAWPLLAALSLLAPRAASADPPPAPLAVAPAPPAVAPAPLAPAPSTQPLQDPPYDASQHGGLSYGTSIKATRGTARRSTGMMATGISFIGLAAVLMATGTGLYAAGDSCNLTLVEPVGGGSGTGPLLPCGPKTAQTTGMALLVAGTISLGVGIPLTVVGAGEVPRFESGSARILNRPPAPNLSIALGLRDVGITLHF